MTNDEARECWCASARRRRRRRVNVVPGELDTPYLLVRRHSPCFVIRH
jgi:hypothetical protein